MAIKKSQIYSTLWNACDALRGSMDASQYKDYVLILLFVKYLSDKASDPDTMFEVPEGCFFKDFVALKGSDSIGESINKKLEAIKSANIELLGKLALPNFNDPAKLGKPKEMTDTLSKLIGVFEDSNLDFSQNRSADDDILGDAYEYLMKNFAEQSGKSKGQFYTPAEVSRVIAKMLRLDEFISRETTIYDPTCGSGSLLLRAIAETPNGATPLGQEKDNATASLAILNMLLHGMEMAQIEQGDTLNSPAFLAAGRLETFDICVANPPFSTKKWLGDAGIDDTYHRWSEAMCPPLKCGDYAFLLHLIASMKEGTGRGACILPHGVLFRGNAEYNIRRHLVDSGVIEGIVGLPANVFFGTGIPASIILINKSGAANRQGIFFIDAKEGFRKEGAKNRLREQDVRRIVDTWLARRDVPHYARFVPMAEIRDNDYNLNIPRYIAARDHELKQDIEAHLHGGIPAHDIEQLDPYWESCPSLKTALFTENPQREGYYRLACECGDINSVIFDNQDFRQQCAAFSNHVEAWWSDVSQQMYELSAGIHPKLLVDEWSKTLLHECEADDSSMVDPYDAYQQFMEYWAETLQDDCYMISRDGWMVNILIPKKNGTYADLLCDLIPVEIVVTEYFKAEETAISDSKAESAEKGAALQQMIDEAVAELDDEDEIKETTADIKKSKEYKDIDKERKAIDKEVKMLVATLTDNVIARYGQLAKDPDEVRRLVIERKWHPALVARFDVLLQHAGQELSSQVTAIEDRYARTLSAIENSVSDLESRVNSHLAKMGFAL